jgi:hypothetical protein
VFLIIIAMMIAFPLAWIATNAWLRGFAYHVKVGADVFIAAGVALVLLTVLTLSYQSLKTALMNPVSSLRTE